MDKFKIEQTNLKKEILNKNSRIRILNNILNNDDNETYLERIEEDLRIERKLLADLTKKLNESVINERKTKAFYKKTYKNLKESFVEFAKVTKGNDNLRKELLDINNLMLKMEKYINS